MQCKSYVMVQCMNTYNSSTAWGYEEECLWGQAHGDAKIEGGGGGVGRGYMQPLQCNKCLSGISKCLLIINNRYKSDTALRQSMT